MEPSPTRQELRFLLELLGLGGLAVAQPLLDLFGRSVDEFIFVGAEAADVVAFALIVAFAAPVALWAVAWPTRLVGPRARLTVHRAELLVLLMLLPLVWFDRLDLLGDSARLAAAAAIAVGLLVLEMRYEPVRRWARYLAVLPAALALWFVLLAPTAALVVGDEAEAIENTRPGNGAPVVVIVLDELPLGSLLTAEGTIDPDVYPNLARLANDGTWYRNTTSVAGGTWYGLPALLTGSFPEEGTMPVSGDYPENLFTLLGGAEYDVEAFEALTAMCPGSVCGSSGAAQTVAAGDGLGDLLSDAADAYRVIVSPSREERDPVTSFEEQTIPPPDTDAEPDWEFFGSKQPPRFAAFMDSLDDFGRRDARYLHLLLPHEPWQILPSGTDYPIPEEDHGRLGFDWAPDTWPVSVAHQRHLLQARYADALVGSILDRLEALGVYEDAVVALTSDHGVAFQPSQPVRGISPDADLTSILPDMAWVPFIVKGPGVEAGAVDDRNAETIDLLPTLVDLLELDVPFEVDGGSALTDPPRPAKQFQAVEISVFGNFLADPLHPDPSLGWQALLGTGLESLAPGGDDPLRLYRIGERGELVGLSVAELDVGPDAGAGFELADAERFDDVELEAGTLPALVDGWIDLPAPAVGAERPEVAIALNGRIAAVGRSFPWEGHEHHFVGIVPEELFVEGVNRVELYLVEEVESEVQLRPFGP